ncbi:MAG: FAD-dependent oxidoreductase, partial [Alphaproteobacteria bacterium]|nr:FAD-dependent oxidoreductase [Alphaproteobacteria bacterium]
RMTDAVHEHGSLAGIELTHNGHQAVNRMSREVPLAPSDMVVQNYDPVHARAMDKSDIKALRKWHRDAALRSKKAGFDVVYVYAGHGLSLPMHFLSRRYNHRTDEYGGSIENRARLFRELIEDTKDAVGDSCAVVVRFAVEELLGPGGITVEEEGKAVIEMLGELPDLWDVNLSDWSNDSTTSRFSPESSQTDYISFVKQMTSKPVVAVGRFTSPDLMVSLVNKGIVDFIGAARPSIADPFLPKKIEEGRMEDIRECIGCNICVSGDYTMSPIRCTQNPTMGEEWRRGWHPERIQVKKSDDSVLIVGGGPSGLEAARALGQRGYTVALAEATTQPGGRVTMESQLPGLAAWARVRDHRLQQINNMPNVTIYLDSKLDAEQIREFGFQRVILATGARWRADGAGRYHREAIPGHDTVNILTPNDVMEGKAATGRVLIFDDDHYYMGGVLAEKLRLAGHEVIFVTPAADVSNWTHYTMEQARIQTRLLELGVEIVALHGVVGLRPGAVTLSCVYTGRTRDVECDTVVPVTSLTPNNSLYQALIADGPGLESAGIKSVQAIGDCLAPSTIAAAVYAGHKAARGLDEALPDGVPFKRELPAIEG